MGLQERFNWEEDVRHTIERLPIRPSSVVCGKPERCCVESCPEKARKYTKCGWTFYFCSIHRFPSTFDRVRMKTIDALFGACERIDKFCEAIHVTAYGTWIGYGLVFFCWNLGSGFRTSLKHPNDNSFYISYGEGLAILFYSLIQARRVRLKKIEEKLDQFGRANE